MQSYLKKVSANLIDTYPYYEVVCKLHLLLNTIISSKYLSIMTTQNLPQM